MATIADILTRHWPGMWWKIDGDDYATLVWFDSHNSPTEKPSEDEIRAWSTTVDGEMEAEERANRQQAALNSDSNDAILTVIERLIKGEAELKRKIDDLITNLQAQAIIGGSKSVLSPWNTTVIANIQAVVTRIDEIRNIT